MKKLPSRRRRPSLPKLSEEMKAWSAALVTEVTTWPDVTTRPMFGFAALYRKTKIFAALPKTRGMGSANALGFRLDSPSPPLVERLRRDPRVRQREDFRMARWLAFEMSSDEDLRFALEWLGLAYEAAR